MVLYQPKNVNSLGGRGDAILLSEKAVIPEAVMSSAKKHITRRFIIGRFN